MSMDEIRVFVCDDHQLFLDALAALIGMAPGLRLVGCAREGCEAIAGVDAHKPDVVLMDLSLPGMSGIAAARAILKRHPTCAVVLLTAFVGQDFAARALAAGARGYVLKSQSWNTVVEAVRTVAAGGTYVAPGSGIDALALKNRHPRGILTDPLGSLTDREREIFDLLVLGHRGPRIAEELGISIKTVESHRSSINRKLHVRSSADLVRFAAIRGLLPQAGSDLEGADSAV
jgi:DNA-binding NarL/FixJ family response regulator